MFKSFLTRLTQFLVGGLFIFSGLVKMNDPVGFSFKLEEYFSSEVSTEMKVFGNSVMTCATAGMTSFSRSHSSSSDTTSAPGRDE